MSLVETDWLEKNLTKVKIIDCSWHMPQTKRNGLEEYKKHHIPNSIFNRKKQGFRAPVGEWIRKDENYFYEAIKEFNSMTNLFDQKYDWNIISDSLRKSIK